MDAQEIAQEMLNYLNEIGRYQAFLSWAEDRGFCPLELDNDIEQNVEGF